MPAGRVNVTRPGRYVVGVTVSLSGRGTRAERSATAVSDPSEGLPNSTARLSVGSARPKLFPNTVMVAPPAVLARLGEMDVMVGSA